jgi:hypothetical protein
MVTIKQNRTNLTSQTFEKSTVARSSNTKTGKGTIKTNLFIFEAKISSIHPIFLKTSPKIIIKKTGTVAFKLKIKFSIITHFL